MLTTFNSPGPVLCGVEECGLRAFGVVRAPLEAIPALRKRPGPPVGEPLPASLLKHADEQTVAGVAAVARAIHDFGLQGRSWIDWGVLGAPRFPGRLCVPEAIRHFLAEGPLGVSPHIIPQRSTHSLSGTVSLAFQMRGPNYGVGGADGALAEGLLAGLAIMVDDRPPGLWLVLTEWDPEPVPEDPGAEQAVCHAVALALVPDPADGSGGRLRLTRAAGPGAATPGVSSLADFLTDPADREARPSWVCPLEWGDVLEVIPPGGPAGAGERPAGSGERPA